MLLAGQIGMTPGRLALEGDLCAQFDRIILSFSKVLIEMLGGEASVSEDIKSDVINKTCLKAILYVSKTTAVTDELM